jgi:hypothetical protein
MICRGYLDCAITPWLGSLYMLSLGFFSFGSSEGKGSAVCLVGMG